MGFTIASALKWWAKEMPDQLAISLDEEPCTFAELYAWSGRVGERLSREGVAPGDRVAIAAVNSLHYAVLAFGVMRIGAIGAPLSFRLTEPEFSGLIDDLTPTLVFTDADREATLVAALGPGDRGRLRSLYIVGELRDGPPAGLDHEPDPDSPVFIIGTSGSTAKPKGVIYTHRTIMTYAAEFAIMEPRCAKGSRLFNAGPFSSSSGYLLLMQFIALGVSLYLESQFDPQRALQILVEKRITTYQGAPIFFERIAALPGFADADFSELYWTQVGGARVSTALLRAWADKGVVLRQLYGSTEAGGGWGARNDAATTSPETCGRGGIFTEYAIGGEGGAFAPVGVPGEILVRGPCVMAGYWDNPQATAEALKDGWLHTGDIGIIDETGNLTFVDRIKDIIISGGLNISAAEIERVIAEIEGVEEVAVIAAADPGFGETPLAIIYAGKSLLSVTAILDHCSRQLAKFKTPSYIVIEAAPLPRLPSGKISKPELRRRFHDAPKRLTRVR